MALIFKEPEKTEKQKAEKTALALLGEFQGLKKVEKISGALEPFMKDIKKAPVEKRPVIASAVLNVCEGNALVAALRSIDDLNRIPKKV